MMILNIMSLVDEEIDAKIKEYTEKNNQENENIYKNDENKENEKSDINYEKEIEKNIQIIEKKDDEHKKYIKINSNGHFKPKESIQIEIYIPKNEDEKKEFQKIRRNIIKSYFKIYISFI